MANVVGEGFLLFFQPLDALDELREFGARDAGVGDVFRHRENPHLIVPRIAAVGPRSKRPAMWP